METEDLAIVAVLLGVGFVVDNLARVFGGPMTGGLQIPFYCLAIFLVMPNLRDAFLIGIASGILFTFSSGAFFPYASIASETVGALICWGAIEILKGLGRKIKAFGPAISVGIATLFSGITFMAVSAAVLALGIMKVLPVWKFVTFALVVIGGTLAVNVIFAQIMYYPAKSIVKKGIF